MHSNRTYIAIDLKSYYASAECVARGLDPLTTNLVVADITRTEKTICLAVSPSLKAYGIPGRGRLFEVVQKVKELNCARQQALYGRAFSGSSCNDLELKANPTLSIDYIVAPPRMAYYLETSAKIYEIYLKYIAPEDIHVYSIDEVFIDVTPYLNTYKLSPWELTQKLIQDVWQTTGITATAGIGTNLFLCKVAMDILAKRADPDKNGVRIAELDELSYREKLWGHRPLTDFWMIGGRTAHKLENLGMYTMGDIAECSIGPAGSFYCEGLLYKHFGVKAELLIDHAWGWESCTIPDIKAYKPKSNSISSGQVLHHPYSYEDAKLIVREMTVLLVLDMVEKKLVTNQMVLGIGYDLENLRDPVRRQMYQGPVFLDHYGRSIPAHAHGSINLAQWTSSTKLITDAVIKLFEQIADKNLLVRRVNISASKVKSIDTVSADEYIQLDLFANYEKQMQEAIEQEREKRRQQAELLIKKKYGKNAILRGMNLKKAGTTIERNGQIGGHKA